MTDQDSLKAMLDEQVNRLWSGNRERLDRCAEYAERCRLSDDRKGEERYLAERADLYRWCEQMTRAIYQPLVDVEMLSPSPISMIRIVDGNLVREAIEPSDFWLT